MDNQLQRLVELQTEQNELLKKHLVRLKFSLMSLLLLTTATCFGLGFVVWLFYHPIIRPIAMPTTYVSPGVSATLQLASPAPPAGAPTQIYIPAKQPAGVDNPFAP